MYYNPYYQQPAYSEADLEEAFLLGYKDASYEAKVEAVYYTPQYSEDFLAEAYLMGKSAAKDDESTLGAAARGAGSVLVPAGVGIGAGALASKMIKGPASERAISDMYKDRIANAIKDPYDNKRHAMIGGKATKLDAAMFTDALNTTDFQGKKDLMRAYGLSDLKDLHEAQALAEAQHGTKSVQHVAAQEALEDYKARQALRGAKEFADPIGLKEQQALDKLDAKRLGYESPEQMRTSKAIGTRGRIAEVIGRLGGSGKINAVGNESLRPSGIASTGQITEPQLADIVRGERFLGHAGRAAGIGAAGLGAGLLAKSIYDRTVG